VHSVVEGGIAERDNRLKVGDKLISVNGTSVVNHSLQVGGAIAIACQINCVNSVEGARKVLGSV